MQYKDHRDSLIRRSVIELIPAMATYNHTEFISSYLHKSMVYLLGQLKKDRDRAACTFIIFSASCRALLLKSLGTTAFTAIGMISVTVQSSMAPYLDPILASVKEGLMARG
jgi:serine/threonine-protein kinase mTOR